MALDDKTRTRVSKEMSYRLRHRPQKFGLLLDPEGFTPIDDILASLSKRFKGFSRSDLMEIVEKCPKGRFEVVGEDIRACYGHTLPIKIEYEPVEPPEVLFHGTAHRFLDDILSEGLLPMDRQYVHLTVNENFAQEVGRRRDRMPAILIIEALLAHTAGIKFYKANENFYLADLVPPQYLKLK